MGKFSKEKFLKYAMHNRKRDEYYDTAYDGIILEKKSFYWNWSAALFQSFWLLYRRMYLEAFLFILVFSILDEILFFFLMRTNSLLALSIIFIIAISPFIGLGLFGTPLYLYCIKKRIEKSKKIPSPAVDKRVVYLAIWPPLLGAILINVLSISLETEKLLELGIIFYLLALSLSKYLRSRFDNRV